MKILICCASFSNLTGSELYVYTLAKELSKLHTVDIIAINTSDYMVSKVNEYKINVYNLRNPPNYTLGDGVKQYYVKDSNGKEIKRTTQINKFYKTSNDTTYDLIILNHAPISRVIVDLYDAPCINIIHSEIIPNWEDPIKHKNVKGYIAIRNEIKEFLIKEWNIASDNIEVIYNPVDTTRFNLYNSDTKYNRILFVGTYDHLRSKVIKYLIDKTESDGMELMLIGDNYENLNIINKKHVTIKKSI